MQALMFARSFVPMRSSDARSVSEIVAAEESFYAEPRRGLPSLAAAAATLGAMALYAGALGLLAG
jgi:hypothetical protein